MGGLELLVILLVVVLIFGPKNLPKLGRALGASIKNFREGLEYGKRGSSGGGSRSNNSHAGGENIVLLNDEFEGNSHYEGA